MRILIIDDSPVDRRIAERALHGLDGVDLATAESGAAALEQARKWPPDLIVVDWNMPGMHGVSFIRTYVNHGGTAPILVAAHEAERADMINAFKAGANHYILKPYAPTTLIRCVREVLSRDR